MMACDDATQRGDVLLAVNDVSLINLTHSEAVQCLKSSSTQPRRVLHVLQVGQPSTSTALGTVNFRPMWTYWLSLPACVYIAYNYDEVYSPLYRQYNTRPHYACVSYTLHYITLHFIRQNVSKPQSYRKKLQPNSRKPEVNPLMGTGNYSATSCDIKLVHRPLIFGLLHLVQQ